MTTEERKAPTQKSVLQFGLVKVPVALMKTTVDPADQKYDTAGPSGNPLHTETRKVPKQDVTAELEASIAAVQGEPLAERIEDKPPPEPEPAAKLPEPEPSLFETKQVLVEDGTGEMVKRADVRRGLRQADDTFLDLTDGLAAIDAHVADEKMRVVKFIDVGQVDRSRVKGSYYLAAESADARFGIEMLRRAMKRTRRVAVVQWIKSKKPALGVVTPLGQDGHMVVLEMAFAEYVREADERFLSHVGAAVAEESIDAACTLIEAMSDTATGTLDVLRDERRSLRNELRLLAEAGQVETFELPKEPEPAEATDVTEAVYRSADRRDEFAEAS